VQILSLLYYLTWSIFLQDSFNADVVPMTVDFLASWADLGRDDPSDVKYWGLALDLSPTGFYVAASLHPHLIKLPPPALPLFREITPDSKPTQQQLRKNEKQYFARLRKLDTFLNTYLPSSTVSVYCFGLTLTTVVELPLNFVVMFRLVTADCCAMRLEEQSHLQPCWSKFSKIFLTWAVPVDLLPNLRPSSLL